MGKEPGEEEERAPRNDVRPGRGEARRHPQNEAVEADTAVGAHPGTGSRRRPRSLHCIDCGAPAMLLSPERTLPSITFRAFYKEPSPRCGSDAGSAPSPGLAGLEPSPGRRRRPRSRTWAIARPKAVTNQIKRTRRPAQVQRGPPGPSGSPLASPAPSTRLRRAPRTGAIQSWLPPTHRTKANTLR